MTNIEQLHLDVMIVKDLQAASKSTQITEQIAIEFGKWLYSKECFDIIHDFKLVGEDTSIDNLYQEFLKTKQ